MQLLSRFRSGIASITAPLIEKLKKEEQFNFGQLDPAAFKAFEKLKEFVASPPMLEFPQIGWVYTLFRDACDAQVGCVLMLIGDEEKEFPPP